MTAAYFEDHPTDPNKIILRKPKHDFGEPWSPVSIGVDVTEEGAHVVGIYALDNDTSQVFYAKYYPVPQRTWVGLTDEEIDQGLLRSDYAFKTAEAWRAGVVFAMTKLKEKNT